MWREAMKNRIPVWEANPIEREFLRLIMKKCDLAVHFRTLGKLNKANMAFAQMRALMRRRDRYREDYNSPTLAPEGQHQNHPAG